MFDWIKRNWLVLGCVAVLLLTVIAGVFQYSWINFASDSHRRQGREAMEVALRNFRRDFRDTLLQLPRFFRPPLDERSDVAFEPYLLELVRRWRSTSDRPQLLASISIGTLSDNGIVFRRLQKGDNEFKPANWPDEFVVYRSQLEERVGAPGDQPPLEPTWFAFEFFQDRPVLIFPLVRSANRTSESQGLGGWCFLEIDPDYLRQHLIPELVARHYGTGARYQVAVVATNPMTLIYGSSAQFDAGIVLLDANLPQNLQAPPRSEEPPVLAGPRGIKIDQTGGARSWVLVVKNKGGSIDALVENARLHILMFSLIMLVLLAGSSVMLVLATMRARRLAKQQMEFVAGVSHELRTPLTVIQSTSYNLSQGTIQDPNRVQQYGDVIQREARRLINQIERMLSFAGIQSGRRVYDLHPIDVTEIVERSLAEYAAAFAEDGWQIERHFAEDLPPVITDGPALESALKNLFENALKYAAPGKWLSVTARTAQSTKGREVQIIVADHGAGIAPKDLPHIFEPFYRGQSVSGTTSGAGLGLCLVERNLRALGGRVTVQATPGGTSFTLHLPVSDKG